MRLTNCIGEAIQEITVGAGAACVAGADATVAAARGSILEAVGEGVKYPSLPNRSSAPFATPVHQLGGLVDGIHRNPEPGLAAGQIGAEAIAEGEESEYLELGTSKMAPRPFMEPAAWGAGVDAMKKSVDGIPAKIKGL